VIDSSQGNSPDSAGPQRLAFRPSLILLVLIVCWATLLRILQAGESLWLDELHTAWTVADGIDAVAWRAAIGNHSPVFFLLVWCAAKTIGMGEAAVRLPSLVAGIALVPLVYWTVSGWTSRASAGLLAAFLVSVDRNCIFYAQEARPYAWVQLVGLIHVVLFSRLIYAPVAGKRLTSAAMGALLFYLHYTSALLFVAELVYYVVLHVRKAWRPRYRPWQLSVDYGLMLVCCLPAAPHLVQIAARRANWSMFIEKWPPWMVQHWFPLWTCIWIPLVVCAAAIVIRWLRLRLSGGHDGRCSTGHPLIGNANPRLFVLVSCWMVVPIAVAWLTTRLDVARLFFPRYVIITVPALIAFAGLCCAASPGKLARGVCMVAVLLAAIHESGIVRQYRWDGRIVGDRNQDWRSAVRALNDKAARGQAPVFVRSGLIEANGLRESHDERLRDYCLLPVSGIYRYEGDLATLIPLPTTGTGRLDEAHRQCIANAGQAWFLLAGPPEEVEKELLRGWKANNVRPDVTERHRFGGVSVLRLVLVGNDLPVAR